MANWRNEHPPRPSRGLFDEQEDQPLLIEDTDELVRRIRLGTQRTWERWQQVRWQPEGTGKNRLIETFDNAVERLKGLALRLEKAGYNKCFYNQYEKPPSWCLVCGVRTGWSADQCPSWNTEILDEGA